MPASLSHGVQDVLANPDFTVIKGTPGADTLVGTTSGFEVFNGNGGSDVFIGGSGDNLFRGGDGVDTYIGGPGFDRVTFYLENQAIEGVSANLATQTIYDDGYGNVEHMSSIEGIGAGSLFADTMIGDDNGNVIVGGRTDILMGAGGDDMMIVADAPALVDGGSGVNTLVMFGGREVAAPSGIRQGVEAEPAGIVVDLSRGLIVDDGFGGSGTILNIQNVYGSQLGDVIIGDARDNVLMGLGGDDTLTGGRGDDIFFFDNLALDWDGNPIGNGRDVITDFQHGHDKIAINEPGVASFADLSISEHGNADVVITYGPDADQIVLVGVHHVTAGDFIFGLT
jgi:Ca2+-binding RTX toxin-like protein